MLAHRLFPFLAYAWGGLPQVGFARRVPVAAISVVLMVPQAAPFKADRARKASRTGHREALGRAGAGRWRQSQRPDDSPVWSPSELLSVREAFVPSLMVRLSKIFINTPDMFFGETPGGRTD